MKKIARVIILVLALTLIMTAFTACSVTELLKGFVGEMGNISGSLGDAMGNINGVIGGVKDDIIDTLRPTPEEGCQHIWFAATCTAPQTCSVCGETKGEALGHTEVDDAAVDVTCTTDGKTAGKHCSVCGTVTVAQETVKAEGHKLMGTVTKEPTCTELGKKEYTCSECDHTVSEDLAALGHNYKHEVLENTCSTSGYTTHTCKVCGYFYRDAFIDPTDEKHEYDEGVVTLAPKCGVKGEMTYTCKTTGCDHTKTEDIAPLEHVYAAKVVAPTCTEYGYTLHSCTNDGCTVSYKDTLVDPIGHDYETVVTEPKCTEMGYTTYTCKHDSDHTYKDDYVAPKHDFVNIVVAPTCTEQGYTKHICNECHTEVRDTPTPIDPDNHDYKLNADETEEKCTRCGAVHYYPTVDFGTTGTIIKVPDTGVITAEQLKAEGTVTTTNKVNVPAGRYVLVAESGHKLVVVENKKYDAVIVAQNVLYISDLAELKAFRDAVNGGNNYKGITVYLAADVDLNNEEWAPIGTYSQNPEDLKPFSGSFDGQGFKVSNLKISNGGYVGLFGSVRDAGVLTDLVIENVNINTTGHNVGALVGCLYTGDEISNITVQGDISIKGNWYVGGINGGQNSYVSVIKDCKVIGNDGSSIVSTGAYAGGITAHRGEGANDILNCTVENITIKTTAYAYIGAITGLAQYGNTVAGNTAKDVIIEAGAANIQSAGDTSDKHGAGAIVGITTDHATNKVTIKDNTFSGEIITNCTLVNGMVVGNNRDGVAANNLVLSNNTINAKVTTLEYVGTAAELLALLKSAAAGTSGNVIIDITNDFDVAGIWESYKPEGYNGVNTIIINGNGHTISNLNQPLYVGTFAGFGGIVINDLTLENVNIVNYDNPGSVEAAGAFIGYSDASGAIELNNCHVKGGAISGLNYVGGLVGYASSAVVVNKCSVVGVTLEGGNSTGAVIGHISEAFTVSNSKFENNKLSSTDDGGWRVGVIAGTVQGDTNFNSITESGNTLAQAGKSFADVDHSNLYGRNVGGSVKEDGVAI